MRCAVDFLPDGCRGRVWGLHFGRDVRVFLWDGCAGITEPIRAGIRDPKLGVGKQEQDDFFTSEENVQRRKLEIEVEETEEHARRREVGENPFICG